MTSLQLQTLIVDILHNVIVERCRDVCEAIRVDVASMFGKWLVREEGEEAF